MTYDANTVDPKVEKHTLLIVRPRVRMLGWEHVSGNIFRVSFPYGFVLGVTQDYTDGDDDEVAMSDGGDATPSSGEFWYDSANKYLYVYNSIPLATGADNNPDLKSYAGMTVEFELYLSDQAFTAPRDPLDGSSEAVDWIPAIREVPLAQIGSRDTLFGFLPMTTSQIQIQNHDGWLNPILYDGSFNSCLVRAFIVANKSLEDAITFSEVKEIFRGYTNGFRAEGFTVSLACTDFVRLFDRKISLRNFSDLPSSDYPNIDPKAIQSGKEWSIRRVFGVLKNFVPVNVDYNATASTTNNRAWATHERDFALDGSNHDDGDVGYNVDGAASNTNTRTYTTETPQYRIGDSIIIVVSGVDKYVFVTGVNRASKYIDHDAISGGGSAGTGDTIVRYFVAHVRIKDPDGNSYTLKAGTDYTRLVDNTNNLRGFILADNVESAFASSPFDPATWEISCFLYGKKGLDQYDSDSSDVGALVNNGGVAAKGISMLYRLLVEAGISQDEIYDSSFQDVEDDSLTMGLAIPADHDTEVTPTYKETIQKILDANLYRIGIANSGSGLAMGVSELKPFPTAGDYSVNELNHSNMVFEHDYSGVYSDFIVKYSRLENPSTSIVYDEGSQRLYDGTNEYAVKAARANAAPRLHNVEATYELETILVEPAEAQTLANRLSYALGDRRGFWTFDLELFYADKANQGVSYLVSRQFMPGYEFSAGTNRTRQLGVGEVNKSARGVTITFEDQKGVQENSSNW